MKKRLLITLLLFGAAACGTSEDPNTPPGNTPETTVVRPPKQPNQPTELPVERELSKKEKCQQDPSSDPRCGCYLHGSTSLECKCSMDPESAADPLCMCLNPDNEDKKECSCIYSPNSIACTCQKDPNNRVCQKDIQKFCAKVCTGAEKRTFGENATKMFSDNEWEIYKDDDCDNDGLSNATELLTNGDQSRRNSPKTDGEIVKVALTPNSPATDKERSSDPCLFDTDKDGLTDYEEINTYGSNPHMTDSDGDGLDDYLETTYNFKPTNANSVSATKSDADQWIVTACEEVTKADESSKPKVYSSTPADITFRFPISFTTLPTEQTLPSPQKDNGLNKLVTFTTSTYSGAIVSRAVEVGSGHSTDKSILKIAAPVAANALTRVYNKINESSDFTLDNAFVGGEALTHDRFKFSKAQYSVSLKKSAKLQTLEAAKKLLPIFTDIPNNSGISDFPGSLDTTSTFNKFEIQVTAIYRDRTDANQVIFIFTVIPKSKVETNTVDARLKNEPFIREIDDLTNTTALARLNIDDKTKCENIVTQERSPKARFLFNLDQSGSMGEENAVVKSIAAKFWAKLSSTDLDFKVGVQSSERGQFHAKGFQWYNKVATPGKNNGYQGFEQEVQRLIDASGGHESGLASLKRFLDSTETHVRPDNGETLIVIFISDEEDQSNKDNVSPDLVINELKKKKGVAFAIVNNTGDFPDNTKPSTFISEGNRYVEVAKKTGGAFAPLESIGINPASATITKATQRLEPTFDKIIEAANGLASPYELATVPITSTLQVFKVVNGSGTFLSRSRVNGFDYSPQNNTISFYGDAAPSRSTTGTARDRYFVYYHYYKKRRKAD